jgi:hypothetical protein
MSFQSWVFAMINPSQQEIWQVVLPSRGRRIVLILLASLLGGGFAYTVPLLVQWGRGLFIVGTLTLISGITGLWSP